MNSKVKYCSVCGRQLRKNKGTIGPICLRRLQGKPVRIRKVNAFRWVKKDIFSI